MIYLSLDQAMRTTGWAIFEDDELKKYGSFTIPSHHPIEQRLNEFMRELNNLYREYEFDELFFEDIQNQKLANITKLSVSLDKIDTIDSVKTKVDGEIGVWESEIELDKMRANGMPGSMELIEKKKLSSQI